MRLAAEARAKIEEENKRRQEVERQMAANLKGDEGCTV